LKSKLFQILVPLLITCFSHAQTGKGKTTVFKLKAALPKCTITSKDTFFLQERDEVFEVKVTGRNPKIVVKVEGAKILSVKDNKYKLRFFNTGEVIISVFHEGPAGARRIGLKRYSIIAPRVFFCGLAVDSATKILRLGGCHLYAWSDHYKQKLSVDKFSMLYYEDINTQARKPLTDTIRAITCKMTPQMKQRVVHFQPLTNKIYFYNMLCTMPDGTFRMLEPVELFATKDSSLNDMSVVYLLRKKKVN